MTKKKVIISIIGVLLVLVILFIIDSINESKKQYMNYMEFNKELEDNDVISATIEPDRILFSLKDNSGEFYTDNPGTTDFKEKLLLKNVVIEDSFGSDDFVVIFDFFFYLLFLAVAGMAIYKFSQIFGGNNFKVIKSNQTRFTDICGMQELKNDMNKTVDLLKNPQKYIEKGIRPPKGIILEGPPGNGKTLFARALAGEANINFIPTKGADFQSAVMSIGPQKIRALFKKARKCAPCIVFIDEFDSIGERRNYTGTGIDKENNRIITAMLNEMDGFDEKDGVLVVGATNSYNSLDGALIRPGRFDKKYNIGNPDKVTVTELIKMYTKNKKLSKELSIDSLSKCFVGISCSAIETLCNEAAMEAENNDRSEIILQDFINAGRKTNIIKINKV